MKILFLLVILFPFFLSAQEEQKPDSTITTVYRPGDHELMFMPTAYTMEKGQSYFEDYELIFINYNMAFTNSTHVGLFSMFPITTDFLETLSAGAKQNVYHTEKLSVALFGSYVFKPGVSNLGAVLSAGPRPSSFHLGLGYIGGDGGSSTFFMLGYRGDFSGKFSFLAEYLNSAEGFDADFSGLLTIGVRFRGETVSWDLGGFRPLDVPADSDFLLFPLLKATVIF